MKRWRWFWVLGGIVGLSVLGGYIVARYIAEYLQDFRDISFDVYGNQIVFNASGRGGRDLFLLDLTTGRVSRLTDSSTREFDPHFAPDGRKVVYAAYSAGSTSTPASLYEIELGTYKVRRLTQSQFADFEPRYMPNGKAILFMRAHRLRPYSLGGMVWDCAQLHWLDLDTGQVYPLGVDVRGDASPDGKLLVVSNYNLYPETTPTPNGYLFAWLDLCVIEGKLDKINFKKNKELIISNLNQDKFSSFLVSLIQARSQGSLPESFNEWVWVENGRAVVFLGAVAGSYDYELWYVRRDGTGLRRLTHLHDYLECVRYDARGQFVYFLREENPIGMSKSLWRLHLPTGRVEKVADTRLFSNPLSFSRPHRKP